MSYRPKIGITMRVELNTRRFYLGRDYSEALAGSGASPIHLPLVPERDYIFDLVATLDGILLPGSDTDVDPLRYGEQPSPGLGTVVPEKDETDLLVLEAADHYKLPVFAICYGMQILNVYYGGTLIQDIGSEVEGAVKHLQGAPIGRRSHSISVEIGSILERALGTGVATTNVNSHHHQAIRKMGRGLRIAGSSLDGVVEAIEGVDEERFILGTQWHPEVDWATDNLSKFLFREFVTAASSRTF